MYIKKYHTKYIEKFAKKCGISTVEKIYIDENEIAKIKKIGYRIKNHGGRLFYNKPKTLTKEEYTKIEQMYKTSDDHINMFGIVFFAIFNCILLTLYLMVLAGFMIEDFIPDLPF